eukprot:4811158-Prymnesium_polylepis.1
MPYPCSAGPQCPVTDGRRRVMRKQLTRMNNYHKLGFDTSRLRATTVYGSDRMSHMPCER